MKKTIKALALVLALGATVQAIKAYAQEVPQISIEDEEYAIARLMELRQQTQLQGQSFSPDRSVSAEFPDIKSETDLKLTLVKHVIRYVFALGAQADLVKEMTAACAAASAVKSTAAACGSEPGI